MSDTTRLLVDSIGHGANINHLTLLEIRGALTTEEIMKLEEVHD